MVVLVEQTETPADFGDCICSDANATDTNIHQGRRAEREGQMLRLSLGTAPRCPAVKRLHNTEDRLRMGCESVDENAGVTEL